MDRKPWIDVIPDSDVASFPLGAEQAERPMNAGSRPALVVVDMTEHCVEGADRDGDAGGTRAVAAIQSLLQVARQRRIPVFFTALWSDPNYMISPIERGRWKVPARTEPGTGFVRSAGGAIVAALSPEAGEIIVHKGMKPSGFFGTPLATYLVQAEVDTVIVVGISTSGCVRATALDAFQHNYHVVIPFECVADRSKISHLVTLFDLHMKYADVVSLAETTAYLDQPEA
ncbi:isochorismatase family protein [Nocardia sp. NPDC004123]